MLNEKITIRVDSKLKNKLQTEIKPADLSQLTRALWREWLYNSDRWSFDGIETREFLKKWGDR